MTMDSLQLLSKRINSTTKLQGIVKSMKTLSAVSIRQYEIALESLDFFVEIVEQGLVAVLRETPLQTFSADISGGPLAFVVFGSDQGLCGRFNEKLSEYVVEYIKNNGIDRHRLKILVIGSRIASRLEAAGLDVAESFWVPGSVGGISNGIYQVLLTVERWVNREKIRYVVNFHNRHQRLSAAEPCSEILLPVDKGRLQVLGAEKWQGRSLPCYRTNRREMFSSLIRQYLMVSLFRSQAESLAAEQASRLRSLQSAEKNIEEHARELQGEFRIKRQATVTSELLDLVAGYKTAMSAGYHPDGEASGCRS